MTDEQKLSFDFVRSVTLQLITISTAVITLTVTFWEKFKPDGTTGDWKFWLLWSWLFFVLSILAGLWSCLAQTGTLAKPPAAGVSIYRKNIVFPSVIQILAFLLAVTGTAFYGAIAVGAAG